MEGTAGSRLPEILAILCRDSIPKVLWNSEGLTPSGLELLHESVERYIKGFLIAKGWKLVKIHDLVSLTAQAATHDPRFDSYRGFARELTDDFFAQHYPGEDWSSIGRNYEELRGSAGEVISLIRQLLPQYFKSEAAE